MAMKKLLLTLSLLALAACQEVDKVQLIQGPQGATGIAGANGHSLVSQFVSIDSESLECTNGGTRLDIYMDMDDSLTVTDGDTYEGSLVACNGANGLNGQDGIAGAQGPQGETGPQGATGAQGVAGPVGPVGPQGPQGTQGATGPAGSGATITVYSSSNCTSLGNGYYGKAGSNAYSIYTTSTCSGSHNDLNSANPTMWISSDVLGVFSSPNTLRSISFN